MEMLLSKYANKRISNEPVYKNQSVGLEHTNDLDFTLLFYSIHN